MSDENSTVRARAERLLQERLHAIGGLEEAVAAVETARATLATAEENLGNAVSTATRAGWTASELAQLGIPVSGQARRAKPATAKRTRRSSTGGSASGAAAGPSGDAAGA